MSAVDDQEPEYPAESNHLLKELEVEREQMTNQIFNMRLRINFLEEKLLMYETGIVSCMCVSQ